MLLGGSVGFAQAASEATVENGQIFLRSGFAGGGANGGGTGGITIGSQGAATFTSDVLGQSDGPIAIQATSSNITFSGDLSLTNASTAGSGITLSASGENTLSVGGQAALDSGAGIDLSAQSAGRISVGQALNAVAAGTVTLSDGSGAGTIAAPTMILFGSGINNQAHPTVTNLAEHVTGDFTTGDLSVPGFLSLTSGGNLTAGNVSAGTVLTLVADGDLSYVHLVRDVRVEQGGDWWRWIASTCSCTRRTRSSKPAWPASSAADPRSG